MSPERSPQPQEEQLSLRELVDAKQAELDSILFGLSEELEMWNVRMEVAAQTESSKSQQILTDIAREALDSLNSKWPFKDDLIHVSGSWMLPRLAFGASVLEYPMEQQEAFHIMPSNGFSVLPDEKGVPQVGLSFTVGEVNLKSAAIEAPVKVLAYADPANVSLYYVRPNEPGESVKPNVDAFGNSLIYYDHLLELHYHNPHSEFFRKSAKHQKKFFDEVIDNVSDLLPSPDSGMPATCNSVTTPYVYRRVDANGQRFWQKINASDGQPILLSGEIQGMAILESAELDSGRPYRQPTELIDPDAGMCMVLQVEECSIADIFNNQPVYVPLRQSEEVEISLI